MDASRSRGARIAFWAVVVLSRVPWASGPSDGPANHGQGRWPPAGLLAWIALAGAQFADTVGRGRQSGAAGNSLRRRQSLQ